MLQKSKDQPTAPSKGGVIQSDPVLKQASVRASEALEQLGKANQFKSATELQILPEQRDALIKTLELFESGKVKHSNENNNGHSFHMLHWKARHQCGTVCCIGGSAELISGVSFSGYRSKNGTQLRELFYGIEGLKSDTTVPQAATALRGYLETGRVDWKKAKEVI